MIQVWLRIGPAASGAQPCRFSEKTAARLCCDRDTQDASEPGQSTVANARPHGIPGKRRPNLSQRWLREHNNFGREPRSTDNARQKSSGSKVKSRGKETGTHPFQGRTPHREWLTNDSCVVLQQELQRNVSRPRVWLERSQQSSHAVQRAPWQRKQISFVTSQAMS